MKTVIFYYTGTGNSLWSARLLAEKLGDATLCPMKDADALAAGDAEAVGFVFPVHVWGIPVPVVQFMERLSLRPRVYLFALAVNAGQVSRTLVQLRGLLAGRGLKLAAGYSIVLPSNYIPWGGAAPAEQPERHASQTPAPNCRLPRPASPTVNPAPSKKARCGRGSSSPPSIR